MNGFVLLRRSLTSNPITHFDRGPRRLLLSNGRPGPPQTFTRAQSHVMKQISVQGNDGYSRLRQGLRRVEQAAHRHVQAK